MHSVITWKKLGIYCKPIIIVNIDGYYDPLLDMFKMAVKEQFMGPRHLDMYTVVTKGSEVVEALEKAPIWSEDNVQFVAELL